MKELQNVPPGVMVLHRSLNPHSKEEEISTLGLEDRRIGSHHQLQLKAKIDCEQHYRGRPPNSEKQYREQDTHLSDAGPREQRRRQRMTPERRTPMSQRW